MIVSKQLVLKVVICLALLYLIFNSIIYKLFVQIVESHEKTEKFWTQELSQKETKITFILIDFEFFDNDLRQTLSSVCSLASIHTVLVVSDRPIYPPIGAVSANCTVHFIVTNFQFNQSLIESRIESHINSEFVVIIPDAVRIGSKRLLLKSIEYLNKLNSIHKTAVILPIGSNISINNANNKCLQIDFDIKRWTLKYRQMQSLSSCDAFDGNDYAVLISRTHLLQLNRPFARPFIESFFIQSKVNDIKVKLFDNNVLIRGTHLFTNARNDWKHKYWSQERQKRFYDTIGVKKMIDSDGLTHWFGCDKHSQRCFPTVVDEMPDYLFANRWTPVCCLDNLAKTGRHVFKILELYSVRYWLEGGSLLGAARNGHIIPWDYDIDIGIYSQDIGKCPYFPETSPIVDENGFVWEKASEGDFFRVHFSQTNRLHVDVFPFYSRNGTMTKNTWFESHIQDTEFPEHFLRPLETMPFIGVNVSVPNRCHEFLEYKFGKNVIQNPKYPKPDVLQFPHNTKDYTFNTKS